MLMGQPSLADVIGAEVVDPALFTNSSDPRCPVSRQCRYSDAALFAYNTGVAFAHAKVAWPDIGSVTYSQTKTITQAGDPVVGMTVHKVGRTTGRTSGQVTETCADYPQFDPLGFDTGRTMLCQSRAPDMLVGPGDSGSPVVSVFLDGTLVDNGLLWGGGGVFANMNLWNLELRQVLGGGLGTTEASRPPPPPPPPSFGVSISGPNEVRLYAACLFQAIHNNGIEPYSYAWTADGTPVGSDSPFYRHPAGTNGFELGITVTDGQGRVANNIFSVSVSYSAPECLDQ